MELVDHRAAVLINAELTDPPWVSAPSIPAMFRATAALARAGLITRPIPPDFAALSKEEADEWLRNDKERRIRVRTFLSSFYAEEGWNVSHVAVETPIPPSEWPEDWAEPEVDSS